MSGQLMLLASIAFGFLAVLALLLQLIIGQFGAIRGIKKRIQHRLLPETMPAEQKKAGIDLGPLEQLLVRAGIRWPTSRVVMVVVVVIGIIIATAVLRGWVEALVALFFAIVASVTLWKVRYEKQRRQIFIELPMIVDAALRSLSAGRSVEQSLILAVVDASPVFDYLVFRLRSAVSQGRDYTQILDAFAELYDIPPMTQVALALRTSSRFGSSVRPVLQEVSKAIRARQELRQEFMSATAETRFTAVVFALMPPGMAVYIVLMNEDFSETLLNTSTGHTMLITAGVLQVLGTGLIWNMIRGVGRG